MYIVVNAKTNIGSVRTDSLELARELASCVDDGVVKLFADWKGPNKQSFREMAA